MSGSKMVSGNGVARWSVVGAAVLVALSLSACGGGGGSTSSGSSSGVVYVSTPSSNVTVSDVVLTATHRTGATAVATDIGFEVDVLKDEDGSVDPDATITLTGHSGTYSDAYANDSKYLATLPFADLVSSRKFVITVSSPNRKPVAVPVDASALSAGNVYKLPSAVRLAKLDLTVDLPVKALDPSSVYLGDGSIPAARIPTNNFGDSQLYGLSYTVELGSMPNNVEGNYTNLNISMLIKGLDSYYCKGNRITVFQSSSENGARANALVYVMDFPNAADASATKFTFPINRAKNFKQAAGKLYAEVAVDGEKCSGGVEYDDIEFSAVTATFAN